MSLAVLYQPLPIFIHKTSCSPHLPWGDKAPEPVEAQATWGSAEAWGVNIFTCFALQEEEEEDEDDDEAADKLNSPYLMGIECEQIS